MEETDHTLPKVDSSKPANGAVDDRSQAPSGPAPLTGSPSADPGQTADPGGPPAGMPTQPPPPPATAVDTPAIADDVDLIEKEWVQKAKHIVDKNKTDPYEQNREIAQVKAEYLKKRYNRDQKLAA